MTGAFDERSLRVGGIEGLRGLAAFGVLLWHLNISVRELYGPGAIPPGLGELARLGVKGVDLFFALSGFLLALPFFDWAIGAHSRPSIRRYAVSRILRIIPAYWAALTFLFLITRSYYKGPWIAFVDYAFLQNYFPEARKTGLSVAWTLGVEVQFYLVLPLIGLAAGMAASRLPGALLRTAIVLGLLGLLLGVISPGLLALLSSLLGLLLGGSQERFVIAGFLLPNHLGLFAAGMFVAVAYCTARAYHLERAIPSLPLYVATAILIVAMMYSSDAAVLTFSGLAWPAALIAAVAFSGSKIRPFVEAPAMHWLGLVSYGLYLWHVPLLEKIGASGWWFGPSPWLYPVNLVIGTTVSLLFAAGSYYMVERSAMALKDRFGRRQTTAAARGGTASA